MTTHYLVYKITNKINGKVYIGTHKTDDLNDGYMGSGKYLKHAIEKHGVENFTKEVLFDFTTSEEMFAKEAELVNEDFLANENTYNLRVGGFGGWDYVNATGKSVKLDEQIRRNPSLIERRKIKIQEGMIKRRNPTIQCLNCPKEFRQYQSKSKFCSSSCSAKYNNRMRKTGRGRIVKS